MQDFKQYKQGLIKIDKIKPYERNAKIHNSLQLEQIKNSILEFGFTNPLIVDSEFNLIAGHGRLEALKMLNRVEFKDKPIKEVNAVFIDGLSETQKRALIIADNKIAENAIWDEELLRGELIELDDLNFDLDLLGFNGDELNVFLNTERGFDENFIDNEKGDGTNQKNNASLVEKFIIPPFSIFDTTQGYWLERKRYWINDVGIKSGEGRSSNLLKGLNLLALKVHNKNIATENDNSIFDPVLCEVLIKYFSPKKGVILDPFSGGVVRGLIAGFFEREYHGVDIREEQIKANEKILKNYENLLKIKPRYYVGDSVNIDNIYQGGEVDFIFSCPPYVDLEVYSDKKKDLSNMDYNDFKKAYFEIIKKCFDLLKDNSFACFVVGEVRDKKGKYYNFVGDTITGFIEAGFSYYNEAILKNQAFGKAMSVEGYFKKSRKLGKIHQNILVFVKGDPVKATEKIGDIEVLKIDCEGAENA